MKVIKFTLLLTLLLCSRITVFAQETLQYKLKVGEEFLVQQSAEQTITQEIEGAMHELTNTMTGILAFKVLKENENTYEIALTFKDLNLVMNSSIQGELMNVQAKEVTEGDVQSQIFNSLLNTPVQLILEKTGNILEVNGGDSLVTKMANASGIEDEFSKNIMKKGLEKEFGSQALSNSYKQMTFIYSDSIVTIGDTWHNEYQGKLNAKNTWTLKNISETEANLLGDAEVSMQTSEAGTIMNLTGKQTTEVLINLTNGFIKKMTVSGEAKGYSTMTQLGEQEIPTTITSKITYELIK